MAAGTDVAATPRPGATPVDETASAPGRGRRWWLVAVLAAGSVLHLAFQLWLARGALTPAAHPDEDGYLLIARALSGGAGGYTNENGPFLRVGYPLLLTPIYAVAGDAFAIFRRALVLDAVVASLTVPLAALFARRVLGMPWRWAVGIGVTASVLPAVTFYSGTVLTDAVLPTIALAWLVLLHAWSTAAPGRARWGYALGSGLMAGLAYTVHVRGTMILIVHGLAVVLLVVTRRVGRLTAVGTVVAAVAAAGLDQVAKWTLGSALVVLGDNPGSQITTAVTADWRVALILLRSVGQLWYLSVGTLGLGAVGLVVAVLPLVNGGYRRRQLAEPASAARLFTVLAALVTTALVAAGNATSLPFGEHRITYFAYPRYLHFLYPVWFMIGFAALRAARPRVRLAFAASAGALLLLTAAVVDWRTAQAHGYLFIAFDAPELVALSGQHQRFTVPVPTQVAFGVFVLVVLALAWRRTAVLALPVVAALCLVSAPSIQRDVIAPMTGIQYWPDTPRLQRDLHLGPGDVVAEAYQVPYPTPFNHAREVSWQRLILFDASYPPPPEASVVIAPWYPAGNGPSWNGANLGMRQIGADPYHGWAAWRR